MTFVNNGIWGLVWCRSSQNSRDRCRVHSWRSWCWPSWWSYSSMLAIFHHFSPCSHCASVCFCSSLGSFAVDVPLDKIMFELSSLMRITHKLWIEDVEYGNVQFLFSGFQQWFSWAGKRACPERRFAGNYLCDFVSLSPYWLFDHSFYANCLRMIMNWLLQPAETTPWFWEVQWHIQFRCPVNTESPL